MIMTCSAKLSSSPLQAATHFNCDYDVLDQLPPNLYLLGIMVAKQLGLKRFAGS